MLALAGAAATNGDGQVFDMAVDAAVRLVSSATREEVPALANGAKVDYKIKSIIVGHAQDKLVQLVRMTLEIDKTDRYSRSVGDILGGYLRVEAANARQVEEFGRILTSTLSFLAVETLKRGWRTSAMRALVIARECANKGLEKSPAAEPMLFFSALVRYPLLAQSLAECAMDQKNTDFLYRCMDMLGYLGCAAVKANKLELGRQCVQSLVQIARKSRFLKLECFWARCGMLPWQHARERVWWMVTWVARSQVGSQNAWLESFSEAYSRISGSTITIALNLEGDRPTFTLGDSKTPHKITYCDTDTVTYDFSDESMLRDLQLY
jgi:hypothetical protein